VPVDYYDYRQVPLALSGLTPRAADLTRLPFPDRSLRSLSCMHAVEHVGLGRYGDPLDPVGDLAAMRELERVLAPGGSLLFVVPVGRARVCYNAHRIYGFDQVVEGFRELRLRQFALIPDGAERGAGLLLDAPPELVAQQSYACGCFWLERPAGG
jgi:SAM-dependent methyltransferase